MILYGSVETITSPPGDAIRRCCMFGSGSRNTGHTVHPDSLLSQLFQSTSDQKNDLIAPGGDGGGRTHVHRRYLSLHRQYRSSTTLILLTTCESNLKQADSLPFRFVPDIVRIIGTGGKNCNPSLRLVGPHLAMVSLVSHHVPTLLGSELQLIT